MDNRTQPNNGKQPPQSSTQPLQASGAAPPSSQTPSAAPALIEARVRPGCHYGDAGPGEIVKVEPRELVICDKTLISVAEEQQRDAESRSRQAAESAKGTRYDLIRAGLTNQWTEIRAARRRSAEAEAADVADRLAALRR